jgi:hypothetical protein
VVGVGGQGRSGRLRKYSPPPKFDLRTVESVVSLYTDYAISDQSYLKHVIEVLTIARE